MPWSKYTKDDPVKAVSLFEKAITKAIEQCVLSKTIQVTSQINYGSMLLVERRLGTERRPIRNGA